MTTIGSNFGDSGINSTGDGFGAEAMGGGDAVGQLNSLLRGEISAAEIYGMAIDKVRESDRISGTSMLIEIQQEHGRACQALRDRIRELGGEPSNSSGAWGTWAKTVQGAANIFGDSGAIKSLKEGEEHGLKDYQEGLDELDSSSRDLIQSQLIPAQQRHINLLDQLLSSSGTAS